MANLRPFPSPPDDPRQAFPLLLPPWGQHLASPPTPGRRTPPSAGPINVYIIYYGAWAAASISNIDYFVSNLGASAW